MAYSSILHIVSPQKKKKKCPWLITWLSAHIFTGLEFICRRKSSFMKVMIYLAFCQQEKTAETSRTITIPCSYSWNPSKGPYSIPICLNKYFCLYPCILIEIILGSYYSFTLPHDAKQQVENEINQASISLRNWQQVVL